MFRSQSSFLVPITHVSPSRLPWKMSCWKQCRSPRRMCPSFIKPQNIPHIKPRNSQPTKTHNLSRFGDISTEPITTNTEKRIP